LISSCGSPISDCATPDDARDFERPSSSSSKASATRELPQQAVTSRAISTQHKNHADPYFNQHPHVLENYLLNYFYGTLLPFGRAASAHFTPASIFDEYLLMLAHYVWLRGLLIGVAGYYREAFGEIQLVETVQSFARAVERDPDHLKKVSEYLVARNLNNTQGMLTLLKP
jgi:lysine-N-methylase